jgi:hypothetical protein
MKVNTITVSLFIDIIKNKDYCLTNLEYFNNTKTCKINLSNNLSLENIILKCISTSLEQLKQPCHVKLDINKEYLDNLEHVITNIISSTNTLNLNDFYFQKAINLSKFHYITISKPAMPINNFDMDKNLTPPPITKVRQITEKDLQRYKKISQQNPNIQISEILKIQSKIKKE